MGISSSYLFYNLAANALMIGFVFIWFGLGFKFGKIDKKISKYESRLRSQMIYKQWFEEHRSILIFRNISKMVIYTFTFIWLGLILFGRTNYGYHVYTVYFFWGMVFLTSIIYILNINFSKKILTEQISEKQNVPEMKDTHEI